MCLKKGLIIQGPLLSTGRTGKTANIPFFEVTEDDITEYNCICNIVEIFNTYKMLFDDIICVTWDDQEPKLINELKNKIPEGSLHIIKDSTEKISPKGSLIPGNNKYRQFLSIYEGSKVLSNLDCDLIVKIRSDQFLDLDFLLRDVINKLDKEERSLVLTPWANIQNSYSILEVPDHYFAAKTQDMLEFSKEYLSYPEIFDNVHTDVFFKWSIRSLSLHFSIRRYIQITSKLGNTLLLRLLINKKISKGFFRPLDKGIIHNLYWRGEKFNTDDSTLSNNEIDYSKSKSTTFNEVFKKLLNKVFNKINL